MPLVRAEPKGKNGSAMNRAAKYFYGSSEGFVKYCNDVVMTIMIEKMSLYEHLEEMLNLDIDMIQFEPSDFSMSVGVPGQTTHPKVVEAYEDTVKLSLKYDKHPRIELASPTNAKNVALHGREGLVHRMGCDNTERLSRAKLLAASKAVRGLEHYSRYLPFNFQILESLINSQGSRIIRPGLPILF